MELIGKIGRRQILYSNVLVDVKWFDNLPPDNWVVFTIGNPEEQRLERDIVCRCLDRNVGYVCCAGQLCKNTELEFDAEIVNRAIALEEISGEAYDYEKAPCTTSHTNFGEGLWFAAVVANDGDHFFDTLVCIDFIPRGVRKHLESLIKKINSGWLPSDEEIEDPEYDNPA